MAETGLIKALIRSVWDLSRSFVRDAARLNRLLVLIIGHVAILRLAKSFPWYSLNNLPEEILLTQSTSKNLTFDIKLQTYIKYIKFFSNLS